MLEHRKLSVTAFVKRMNEEHEFCTRQHFAKLLQPNSKENCSIGIAIMCCEFFGVSLDNLISAALKLNYSNIIIEQESLEKLIEVNKNYAPVVTEILKNKIHNTLFLKEQEDIYIVVKKYFKSDEMALEFMMKLRELSYEHKYNKVSAKADNNIYNMLGLRGYYKGK